MHPLKGGLYDMESGNCKNNYNAGPANRGRYENNNNNSELLLLIANNRMRFGTFKYWIFTNKIEST